MNNGANEGQAAEVNTAELGTTAGTEAASGGQAQAAEVEFDRSQVQDPMLRSLFAQLDRIEALQSRLAQRFL